MPVWKQVTAPATGNVKMKRVCFRSKRVCFSSANVGVVFSLFRNQKKVTVSALFCILMDNPWYTKGFSIRDIPHATLEEEEIFVSKKTWYRLLRKYCTAWEDHTYRPTGLRRAYRKTALTVDWLVGWLVSSSFASSRNHALNALLFPPLLGRGERKRVWVGHQMRSNAFHFDVASGRYCMCLSIGRVRCGWHFVGA